MIEAIATVIAALWAFLWQGAVAFSLIVIAAAKMRELSDQQAHGKDRVKAWFRDGEFDGEVWRAQRRNQQRSG